MTFLKLPINLFFFNFFFLFYFVLNINQLNISKKIKKDYKKARKRYQNLSKEEKRRKPQHGYEPYKNLPEYEKEKLVEYSKKYFRMRKNVLLFETII